MLSVNTGLVGAEIGLNIPDFEFGDGGGGTIGLPGGGSIRLPGRIEIPIPGGLGTNEQATAIVNAAEQVLIQNLEDFKSGRVEANEALAGFDAVWQQVMDQCNRLGNRGCVSDRQRGGRFDWFAAYRDTIQAPRPGEVVNGGRGGGIRLPGVRNGVSTNTLMLVGLAVLAFFILRR